MFILFSFLISFAFYWKRLTTYFCLVFHLIWLILFFFPLSVFQIKTATIVIQSKTHFSIIICLAFVWTSTSGKFFSLFSQKQIVEFCEWEIRFEVLPSRFFITKNFLHIARFFLNSLELKESNSSSRILKTSIRTVFLSFKV